MKMIQNSTNSSFKLFTLLSIFLVVNLIFFSNLKILNFEF